MSSKNGYIKLYRKMIDWGWYRDANVKILFLHLLLIANFKESNFEDSIIKPGQMITSIGSLAKETGLTSQNVRTALEKLETSKIITKQSTSRFTLITIENWALYQEENSKVTSQLTNNQQTANKRLTNDQQHHKNAKNNKNANKCVCNNNINNIYKGSQKTKGQRSHTQPYGEFQNVFLQKYEYEQLCQRYLQVDQLIDKVSIWLTEHERKNHYALCLKFARSDSWPKKSKSSLERDKAGSGKKKRPEPMPEQMRKKYGIREK